VDVFLVIVFFLLVYYRSVIVKNLLSYPHTFFYHVVIQETLHFAALSHLFK
jgi:hypothetical protein